MLNCLLYFLYSPKDYIERFVEEQCNNMDIYPAHIARKFKYIYGGFYYLNDIPPLIKILNKYKETRYNSCYVKCNLRYDCPNAAMNYIFSPSTWLTYVCGYSRNIDLINVLLNTYRIDVNMLDYHGKLPIIVAYRCNNIDLHCKLISWRVSSKY